MYFKTFYLQSYIYIVANYSYKVYTVANYGSWNIS